MSPVPFKKSETHPADLGKGSSFGDKIEVGSETGIEEEEGYEMSGIEHDKHVMLQELKKYFKPEYYDKVCEFQWERIRRLFGILKGR